MKSWPGLGDVGSGFGDFEIVLVFFIWCFGDGDLAWVLVTRVVVLVILILFWCF